MKTSAAHLTARFLAWTATAAGRVRAAMRRVRLHGKRGTVALCLAAGLLVALSHRTRPMRDLEFALGDQQLRRAAGWFRPRPEIVLIAVDDETIARMQATAGPWPWSPSVFAGAVEYCTGAKVLALDIPLTKPDDGKTRADPLSDAVRRHRRVVNAIWVQEGGDVVPLRPGLRSFALMSDEVVFQRLPDRRMVQGPYEALQDASAAIGHVHERADEDGVVRRVSLFARRGGIVMPSLALSAYLLYHGLPPSSARIAGNGDIVSGDRRMSLGLDPYGTRALFPVPPRYPVYSLSDVLESRQAEKEGRPSKIPRSVFKDRIVLVGSFATGLQSDLRLTSLGPNTPGVLIIAGTIDNLLSDRRVEAPPRWLIVLIIIGLALVPALIRRERPLSLIGVGVAAGAAYLLLVYLTLVLTGLLLPAGTPLLALGAGALSLGLSAWFREQSHRTLLEQSESAKQQFTDMLVHDLKGRAGTISMSLSLLERRLPADDKRLQRIVSTARMATNRLLLETKTLLDIRKIQEGRMEILPVRFPVGRAMSVLLQEHRAAAEFSGVTLVFRPSEKEFYINADQDLFSRMIGNLIWNALTHALSGSLVEFGVEPAGLQAAAIWVANRGASIPPEEQSRLFQPFISGGRLGVSYPGGSTGLGLTFCRLAAEAHRGSIRLESPRADTADGVRVTIILPG